MLSASQRAQRAAATRRWRERNPEKSRESTRQAVAKWRAENPEHAKAYLAKWRAENPEKVREHDRRKLEKAMAEKPEHVRALARERTKRYRERNPEYVAKNREAARRWRHENPERRREYEEAHRAEMAQRTHAYRGRKRSAVGSHTAADIVARFAVHGNRCIYCGSTERLQVEHLIPLSRGGSNWPANLAPACAPCNQGKRDKTFAEFMEMVA
jgi:5-methylcytosine-specific restriction endonuclease McrA